MIDHDNRGKTREHFMSNTITAKAYVARQPKSRLEVEEICFPQDLAPNQVELKVLYCGICYSDISMINNDWGISSYPLVPGHEVVGQVVASGANVTTHQIGDVVGLGWFSRSCLTCCQCLSGNQNLCAEAEGTIVRPAGGGFATRVRADATWVIKLGDGIAPESAGPLFCGGITVFNPFLQLNIKPTDRIGVIGIGGLGSMALQFAKHWGCEVSAFSTSTNKEEEAHQMGAHSFINTNDEKAFKKLSRHYDVILSTVHADIEWTKYLALLRPQGKLHIVGAAPSPLSIPAFNLITGQLSVSGSPLGSPNTIATMLEFVARHKLNPITEIFPANKVNEAIEHVRTGKVRYRAVLDFTNENTF
jgi:uncharacterized zinc-type alcohol dehydrogenase-like protein